MPAGRPTKYKKEYCKQAKKLAYLGATDRQVADFFEIAESTLNEWKKLYPDFSESLKSGKTEADNEVERSLFQRAKGYSHDAVHISNYKGDITETPYTEHYPPDTTACIFWLKNRRPAEWRDKQEHAVEIPGGKGLLEKLVDGPPQETYEEWAARKSRERQG